MKCPICNHELDIKSKKTGETENGEAIYNEFAICHDCKKQWNLDKQRAKTTAKPSTKSTAQNEAPASEAPKPKRKKRRPASTAESIDKPAVKKPRPVSEDSEAGKDTAAAESPRPKKKKRPAPEQTAAENGDLPVNAEAPKKRVSPEESAPKPRKKKRPVPKTEPAEAVRPAFGDEPEASEAPARPRPKKKRPAALSEEPVKTAKPTPRPKKVRPVSPEPEEPVKELIDTFDDDFEERPKTKRRRAIDNTEEEITYSNIPPKHVRDVREQEMRDNYQTMLSEGDEEWEDDDRRFPVWLIIIIVLIVLAAAGFAGYWFLLR